MRSLPLRSIWQIVSEINLAEIQSEIESPFHLLIAADDEADAEHAANRLSAPAADFYHPWITVTDSTGSGLLSQSTEIAPRTIKHVPRRLNLPARLRTAPSLSPPVSN